MSLYKNWTDMVISYVKQNGEAAFWKEYGDMEEKVYTEILATHETPLKGSIKDLAQRFNTSAEFFMGFVDGINESLVNPYDLENVEEDQVLEFNVDFEKLYFNMLDAKADYLYNLPQWEAIFSIEKRKEILKAWRESKVIVRDKKVGRNDPCPCGSGKKYKKCCGVGKADNE